MLKLATEYLGIERIWCSRAKKWTQAR